MSDLDKYYIDIHCVDLVELVTDYLDDALAPADLERFDEHVEGCDGCRVYVDQVKMTISLTGDGRREAVELPGNFDRLLQLFDGHKA